MTCAGSSDACQAMHRSTGVQTAGPARKRTKEPSDSRERGGSTASTSFQSARVRVPVRLQLEKAIRVLSVQL
eukprot:15482812-Alexandrium_andersonii.AAC.1